MSDSPLPRVFLLSFGLIGASALMVYLGLGFSMGRTDTAALAGLPEASREQARQLYSAIRWMPWDDSANMRLGEFFLTNERPAAAAVWLTRAARWDEGSWQAWYYLGLADRRMHRYAQADADFRKVLSLNPDYVAARLRSAELLLDQGRGADALLALAALDRTGADQTRVALAIGRALLRQGRYQDAKRAFDQALARFPNYGDAHAGLAAALRGLGETAQADREARQAQIQRGMEPLATDDPLTEEMEEQFPTGRSLFERAARNSDPRIAIDILERALALDPGMTNAWERLISLYGQAKRPRDAERAWSKLARIDPGSVRGRYNLGVSLGQCGERDKAVVYLNQALQIDPSYQDAHRMLGQIAELDGRNEEAAREFRTAFTNDPALAEAHTDLAMLLLKSGQTREAQSEFLRALLPPCEQPERTLARELAQLRDQPMEPSFEDAVRAQAAQNGQPALITYLNNRKKPAATKPIGLPGLDPEKALPRP